MSRRRNDRTEPSRTTAGVLPAPGNSRHPAQRSIAALRRRHLLARFWRGGKGFWGLKGDNRAWTLSGCLLLIILANVAVLYGINLWNRAIFDALEQRNARAVLVVSLIFLPLATASIALGVAAVSARMTLQRRWRAWLNDHIVDRWLANGRYYQLNLLSGEHENPEYRIAQDLRVATDAPVDFAVGIVSATLSAATFVAVLWSVGGSLSFPVADTMITIPGFLVAAAILYAAAASGSMMLIGRHFVVASEAANQAEAEYRYVLTRVRENGESIALLGGESEERVGLRRSMAQVLRCWQDLCGQHMRTTIVSQGSSLIAPVIPIVLAAPKFLDGTMTLGEIMQAASAFTIVQGAFGWLVDNYPRLADWAASARRIASLTLSLDALERAEARGALGRITHGKTEEAALRLRDLSVTLDDGTAVVSDADVVIRPGERVLVAGETGSGKSTLVRAIAGLWPWGDGTVETGADAKLFFLPQQPYVPTGTLRRAAAYPAGADHWRRDEIAAALTRVGLDHLAARLDDEAPWDQTLSGGEKQRLAFARLILHRPDIVVLDEATSALDPAGETMLMELTCRELDKATIVSVAHRPELEAFHSRKIVFERRGGGAKLVSDVPLSPRPAIVRPLRDWLARFGWARSSGSRHDGSERP